MRLLLVDDDEVLLDALPSHFVAQRYAVDIASDGEEAWEYIMLFSYDLVVLDVMLPKIDGISLCKKLRSHNYTMPILMLTARDRSTDIVGPDSSSVLKTSPLLLIVDRDSEFTQHLATEAAANNLRTAIATTASQAQEIIKRDRPAVVFLKIFQIRSTSTQDSPIDSLDLLTELHQQMPSLPIVLIVPEAALFNTNKDFANRLKSVRRGEHTLLVQPVTPTQAILSVTQLLRRFGTRIKIAIA